MKKETIQIKYQRRKLKKTTQIKEKPWNSNKKENTQLKRKLFSLRFLFLFACFLFFGVVSFLFAWYFFVCVVSFLFIWFLLKIPFTRAKQIGTARQI